MVWFADSVDDSLDKFNAIEELEESPNNKDYLDKAQLLREHHRDLRDGYDRLFLLSAKGPASKEFVEPKVQGLWKIALESNFKSDELESLRIELLHYENRLLKLRHLQAEQALKEDFHNKKAKVLGEKPNGHKIMEDSIRKHARKVEKIHLDLETKIMQRHIEL